MIDPFFARLDSPEYGNVRMITDKKGDTWSAAFDLIRLFGLTPRAAGKANEFIRWMKGGSHLANTE